MSDLANALTRPVTANPRTLSQALRSRQAFDRPQYQGASGALEYAAGVLAGVPGVGDVAGFANDVNQMRRDPEQRTGMNMGLAALGLIPFVPPAMSYGLGRLAQARGVSIGPAPGSMAAAASGERGTFIGPKAATWDSAAASRAAEMEKAGVDQRAIWQETGTLRGPDGMLRQEIDDSQSMFRGVGPFGYSTVGEAVHHPQFIEAYPDAAGLSLRMQPGIGGSYHPGAGVVSIGSSNDSRTHSVALHELQHAVQGNEGFSSGGNPAMFAKEVEFAHGSIRNVNDDLRKFSDALTAAKERGDAEAVARFRRLYDDSMAFKLNKLVPMATQDPLESYRRLAGETEARATQARMNMTPAERRAKFPYDSYDVPVDQLIVR